MRTQEEYDAGHIAGSVLIPNEVLLNRLDEVPTDKPILVYCRTARRSAIASQDLINNGYSEVYNGRRNCCLAECGISCPEINLLIKN